MNLLHDPHHMNFYRPLIDAFMEWYNDTPDANISQRGTLLQFLLTIHKLNLGAP